MSPAQSEVPRPCSPGGSLQLVVLERNRNFLDNESGYMRLQCTKPQTIAHALNDSPAGLASWIVEKRRTWSDCGGDVERRFSKDDLCTTCTLYWITESYGTSARYYAISLAWTG